MRPVLLFLLALTAITHPILAQTLSAGQDRSSTSNAKPLTVEAINQNPTGTPPQDAVWSPDDQLLTFLSEGRLDTLPAARAGDILAIDAATGKPRVLVSARQINALSSNPLDEKNRDHRSRYHMPSFLWSPDSKHLLLDRAGKLWLWDLQSSQASLIVNTNTASGDDPRFSPDGQMVSYIRGHNLYVHQLADAGSEIELTSTPADVQPDALLNGDVDWVYLEELEVRANYAWSPDSQFIAYLQMNEEKVPQYPIVDYIPTHATVDWQRYPQAGDPNPAVRVGIVAASASGASGDSAAARPTTWIDVPLNSGNDYIPRFGWVDEHTVYVEVLTRDQKHLNLYLADARSGAAHLIHSETDAKYLEDNYDVTFLPHGRFLNTSWQDGHTHIYLYGFDAQHPLTTEAHLLRQLTHGDYEVEKVSAPERDGDVQSVFFTSNEGSPLETHLWTMQLDGTRKRELTPEKGSHNTLMSPGGRYFTDESSRVLTPPSVRLCASATQGSCTDVWQSQAAPDASGTQTRIVTFKAADGVTTLYGRLTEPAAGGPGNIPASSPDRSVPIILNPYGGPLPTAGVTDSWGGSTLEFDQLLAQHGMAVLHVDNRGSGGRGRDFQQADYRNFGPVQLSDQLAALDQALASDTRLDPSRTGWWGWSWGGFFTLYAMTHTDRLKAGIAVAPGSTDLKNYDSVYAERYMGLPAEEWRGYGLSNVNNVAGHLHGRVLIAQGTGDDNVHMENAMQFIQGLITAGIPYDLQIFPRLTHSLATQKARNELLNRILFQFETYLVPIAGSQH